MGPEWHVCRAYLDVCPGHPFHYELTSTHVSACALGICLCVHVSMNNRVSRWPLLTCFSRHVHVSVSLAVCMWPCLCTPPWGVRQGSEPHLALMRCLWGEGGCHTDPCCGSRVCFPPSEAWRSPTDARSAASRQAGHTAGGLAGFIFSSRGGPAAFN